MIRSLFDIPDLKPYINAGVWGKGIGGPMHTLDIPPIDAQLWRYMNFAKFVSMLETRQLFFTRADKLDDPFEGAWSEPTLRLLDGLIVHGDNKRRTDPVTGDSYLSEKEAARSWKQIIGGHSQVERRFTLINCWREGEHESEAMWNQTPRHGEKYELAIKSDFKSFVHSFPSRSRLPGMVARVEYIPYQTKEMPLSLAAPYFHKRIEFQDEHEVRAIMSATPLVADPAHPDRDDVKAPDYSRDICDIGLGYEVNPADLIHEVVMSPHAPSWLTELVVRVIGRYGLKSPVSQSRLLGTPRWQ